MSAPPDTLLGIYLDDHAARAAAMTALAHRFAANNAHTQWHGQLEALAQELESEQAVLEQLRSRYGRRSAGVKQLLARMGERIGRLKLNGQRRGYSPLSRLEEVEVLMAGISAGRRMWIAVAHRTGPAPDGAPDTVEPWSMVERAEVHLRLLDELHEQAADVALRGATSGRLQPAVGT